MTRHLALLRVSLAAVLLFAAATVTLHMRWTPSHSVGDGPPGSLRPSLASTASSRSSSARIVRFLAPFFGAARQGQDDEDIAPLPRWQPTTTWKYNQAKYFLELPGQGHVDRRYGRVNVTFNEWQRKQTLLRLFQQMVDLFEERGVEYWLDYGSLLGAWREGGFISWDLDMDVSVRRHTLIDNPRLSLPFETDEYVLDVNPNIVFWQMQPSNQVEARFIDKGTGLYIDFWAWQEMSWYMYKCMKQQTYYPGDELLPVLHSPDDVVEWQRQWNEKEAAKARANKSYTRREAPNVQYTGYMIGKWIVRDDDGGEFLQIMKSSFFFPLQRCGFENITTWCPNRAEDVLHEYYGPDLSPFNWYAPIIDPDQLPASEEEWIDPDWTEDWYDGDAMTSDSGGQSAEAEDDDDN